jgi:uncharacterized membrane protein YvlD (DUF360 family)
MLEEMPNFLRSWLAMVAAAFTVLLLPNVSASSWVPVVIVATLLWLVHFLIWPILKVLLLPFNLATFGFAGTIVYTVLFWLCLWLYPGFQVAPLAFFGGSPQPGWTLFLFSFCLLLLFKLYLRLIARK